MSSQEDYLDNLLKDIGSENQDEQPTQETALQADENDGKAADRQAPGLEEASDMSEDEIEQLLSGGLDASRLENDQAEEENNELFHASDMDLNKPINWKRQLKTNGAYGCMGDLGIHTQHLPFRLGFRVDSVSAQLADLVPQRPCGDGFAPCETYDNAILLCGAHNAAGDRFPMVMEMKRMAPGCTNTVEYEIYGLDGSAKFSTEDANAVWYTRNQGREQAWSRLMLGQKTLFPVITGGIFEFGFSDAMLQMFAAFIAELCGEPCAFGCFRPDEALLSHQLLTGALRAYETGSVVRFD